MRNHRLVILSFAAAIATASGLAVAAPAHASGGDEDQIVKLVSYQSDKCLQPLNVTDQEEPIVQETCNGRPEQQWTVHFIDASDVHLKNRATGLCMESRDRAHNGSPIDQWPCNWISNENWSFGITNNLLSSGVSNTFSHCVATPGVQDGLAMELRFCDGDPAQLWNRPNG